MIKIREKQFEKDPTGVNRDNLIKAQAELSLQLKREENFWRQKVGFEWFKDGEKIPDFFMK